MGHTLHKAMATIAAHAASGDWRSAFRISVTTGIVLAQSASWDRAIGRAFAYVLGDSALEPSVSAAMTQAIVTTVMGVVTIYAIHQCTT